MRTDIETVVIDLGISQTIVIVVPLHDKRVANADRDVAGDGRDEVTGDALTVLAFRRLVAFVMMARPSTTRSGRSYVLAE